MAHVRDRGERDNSGTLFRDIASGGIIEMNDLQSSFSECLAWWALTFVNGIAFREFSRDPVGRWIGRASVATSCFVLISFCQYATHQCQVQYQVTVVKPGKEISHAKAENQRLAASSENSQEILTPSGRLVTLRFAAGDTGSRSVSGTTDGIRWSTGGYRFSGGSIGRGVDSSGGQNGSVGYVPFSVPELSDAR